MLAAGSVLRVGAAVTLATWNDSEYAQGTVTAGTFTVEGAVGDGPFSARPADDPHTLTFSDAQAMTPGSRSYALFSVRTGEGSTAGTVQMLADESNGQGLGQWLSYSARVIEAGTTCGSAVFENGTGTAVVPRGSAVTASSESSQELAEDRGSVVSYCLELTLPEDAPNEAQGAQGTPLWEFRATSSPE